MTSSTTVSDLLRNGQMFNAGGWGNLYLVGKPESPKHIRGCGWKQEFDSLGSEARNFPPDKGRRG